MTDMRDDDDPERTAGDVLGVMAAVVVYGTLALIVLGVIWALVFPAN